MEKKRPFALLLLGLEATILSYVTYLALKPESRPESKGPSALEEKVEDEPLHQFLFYEASANLIVHPFYLKPYKE